MCDQFGTGFGANLASEFVKLICREICYVFKYKSHVKDLGKRVKEIIAKRDREQQRVDHAIKQGDHVIHEDVELWLTDVDQFIRQVADPITGEEGRAKSLCFKGCPNLITRYKFSKKALKAANDGANLVGKSFSTVSYRLPPQRTSSMYVDRDYEAFDSRESILQEIMEALRDANVNRIGVYGMGGVGKTTLVNKVVWQAIEDKLFDDVAITEVTQKPDNRKIQDKIASDLGLQFEQHENEYVRADRLRNKLKKGKRVLVILDNIWAKPDFKAIGIPFGDDEKGIAFEKEPCEGINDDQSQRVYKILLTSRRQDILCNEIKTDKIFPLETLSEEEAQNLFWKIMGDGSVESSDRRPVGEEIVRKCAGLPLAIATIANALKNKSLDAWKDALHNLKASNPRSIPGMDEKLFSVIEISFNLLQNDEAKSLLLLCSLKDAGRNMSLGCLLRYGMGLGLFKDIYTLENGRNRVHMLIDHLKASCLLIEGDSKSWVKMHEVVHTVAASIASTNELMFNIQDVPNLNKVLEDKISKNPTAISLPYRDISELPERLGCPKLELFFLFVKSDHSLQVPDSFFEGIKQLKVIGFDGLNLLSLPSSFGHLTNLQTLCLDGCLLGDMSTIGELKNLEILSFSRSNIEQLPEKIGQLTRLQLLDLSDCSSLKVIPANVISRLSRLEELYLDNSSVQWESGLDDQVGSNASLAELNKLSLLTTLNIRFSDAQIIPPNLFCQQLKRFKILIGDVLNWSHRNEASRTLKLKLNNNSFLGYKPIKILLKRTEDLFLDELNGIQDILYELDEEGFLNLKHLRVDNCSELLYVVNSEGRIQYNAFPMLELLCLRNLVNLGEIWHGPLKEASFNKLKTIQVYKCDELKHLFSISMAKSLSQLQEIEVTDCKKLKVIFSDEDDEGCVHNENVMYSKIRFPQLHTLTLERVPQFTSFIFNVKTSFATNTTSTEIDDYEDFKTLFHEKVEYPSLENLNLSSVSIEMIWPEQLLSIASYSQTVKCLTLENCNGLKFLFSSSMVKSFAQLQHLELCNCESMECVLDTKELGGEESISFPKLLSLELKDLPKVTRFGNGNTIEFPSLNTLIIENCPNLKTFVSNNTCTHTTLSNELKKMNSVEKTRADKQPLFGDKVGLPNLEVLKVHQMQNLRKIWDNQLSLYSFCKMKYLRVKDCSKLLNIFPFAMLGRLQSLENLKLMNCDSLEEVFELQVIGDRMTPVVVATQLKELHVCRLPTLKRVWSKDAQAILAFENLIRLRVHSCQSLKNLFPASVANGLIKLEELEIHSCSLGEIVSMEDKVDEAVIPRFMFPRLNSLSFHCLPALTSFYPERHFSEWPVLKKMKVSGCRAGCGTVKILASEWQSQPDHLQSLFVVDKVAFPSLEELKLSQLPELLHLWGENSQSRVFQNLQILELSKCENLRTLVPSYVSLWSLEKLDVKNCDKLISLLTLSTAKSLVNLRRINIADCKKIEEIITHEGDKANNDYQIVLKQLNYLGIHRLPSLTCFCYLGNYVVEFPSLEKLIVGHCPKMVMLERVVLKEGDDWQDNQDSTEHQLFKEMVGFQGLKYLKVSEFPQLKKIWHDQLLPGSFFCNLTSLVVDNCADIFSAISANLLQFLNNLEMLEVRNCDSLEQVFDLEELGVDRHPGLLSQLSHFYLIHLPKLKHICRRKSYQQILAFKNLQFLEVQNCDCLRYIFTASTFSGLKQLQEMKIMNCAMLEVIITNEEEEDATDKIVLPLLNSIFLESLPELASFYSGINILECPSLETFTITNCTKMEAFVFTNRKDLHLNASTLLSDKVELPALVYLRLCSIATEMIGHKNLLATSCIQNLIMLHICGCDNLRYLLPSCLVKSLVQLRQLDIHNCMSMEGVILTEEERMSETKVFPRLAYLSLRDLPKLKMFSKCTGNLIEFPSLSTIAINNCSSMETFISNSISANAENLDENLQAEIQPLFDEKVALPNLAKLVVCNMDNLRKIWDDQLTFNSFNKLKDLTVVKCCGLMNIFPSIMHGRLQKLHNFEVVNCESLEEIFEAQELSFERTDAIAVGQLREIHLCELPKLKHAWSLDAEAILSSDNLHSVKVHYCDNLKCVFPASVARGLHHLKELEVTSCLVEEIVAKEEVVGETVPRFLFSQLASLSLKELPKLQHFYPGIHISEWPVLENLMVYGCDKVKIFASEFVKLQETRGESPHEMDMTINQQTLFLVEKDPFPCLEQLKLSKLPELLHLWNENSQPSEVFQNLAILKVSECGKLKNIVPSSLSFHNLMVLEVSQCDGLISLMTSLTGRRLVQLIRMEISDCKSIQEIITDLEDKGKDEIAFKELEYLGLERLPSLRRFYFGNCALEFPSLDQVIVRECSKMETFSQGVLRTPKLQRLQLTQGDDEGRWQGDLNTTIQFVFKEMKALISAQD